MNKVKKFEISVVDRTYSKIVSNLVKFYSSDSALEVIFILAEEGYEFDSAELVLSNTDGSLITRPLTKVPEGYSYEFEKNIIAHHGEWKGQVILHSANDAYVSSKILITIEDDLLSEQPPKLTDVYSWTSLKRYADDLVDELKQAVLSVEGMGDAFNANESERQNQFETSEQSRQDTFESNETMRQSQELEREGAEATRQIIFDDNEANRSETFNTNEATRQENETTRHQAELVRVGNENQREIDHANRSAELAGKADKVVIKNLIENGDFSNGVNSWYGNKIYVTSDEYVSPSWSYFRQTSANPFYQDIPAPSNNVLYVCAYVKGLEPARLRINHFNTFRVIRFTTFSKAGEWDFLSEIITTHNGGIRLDPQAGVDWGSYYDNFITIDLTDTFGSGNEPTKEEMDELIKVTGYIDGEYTLNNKEMLGHLMKGIREKADKKQEGWITPTLLNGATSATNNPIGYFKDSLGFVHFKGRLSSYSSGVIFTLPVGYRPLSIVDFRTNRGSFAVWINGEVRTFSTNGDFEDTNLVSISFRAEG